MDIAQRMFLLAAEEMNFTRAAKRANVTQQCLSIHIKQLEKELGTKLFERSPHLSITASGIALQQTLLRISSLEKNLTQKIQEIENGQIGEIRIGLNATRAHILLPEILPRFHQLYPKVSINVVLRDTEDLVQLMLDQKLDILLGVDYPPHPLLSRFPVGDEILILTATNQFLQNYYSGEQPWQDFHPGDLLDFRQFKQIPLVGNREKSTVQHLYTAFLHSQDIYPRQIVSISDYRTQFELCKQNLAATFSSSFMYHVIQECNKTYPDSPPLIPLRLLHDDSRIQTHIYIPKRPFMPRYLHDFLEILTTGIKKYHRRLQKVLELQ